MTGPTEKKVEKKWAGNGPKKWVYQELLGRQYWSTKGHDRPIPS